MMVTQVFSFLLAVILFMAFILLSSFSSYCVIMCIDYFYRFCLLFINTRRNIIADEEFSITHESSARYTGTFTIRYKLHEILSLVQR